MAHPAAAQPPGGIGGPSSGQARRLSGIQSSRCCSLQSASAPERFGDLLSASAQSTLHCMRVQSGCMIFPPSKESFCPWLEPHSHSLSFSICKIDSEESRRELTVPYLQLHLQSKTSIQPGISMQIHC